MTAEQRHYKGPEEYVVPATVTEAAQALADGAATVVAGGTDLMVQTGEGRIAYRRRLVNICRVDGMRGTRRVDDVIRIGALTTMTDILGDKLLRAEAPILPETADQFASDQIRNAATLGGNLCNASPAADCVPPLLVLNAEVELSAWKDGALATRAVSVEAFFAGPGSTVKADDELLTAVSFPVPEARFAARFIKSGPRPALEIATVSAALGAVHDGDVLRDVRVALGAVAPTPIRAPLTEAFLEGKAAIAEVVAEAADIAAGEVSPIDDVRASAWYRQHLVRVFIGRLLGNDS